MLFRSITRVLSLALLVGQLGAEAHAYSHLSDDTQGLPETTQSCRACLSFAPLLSAVGGSSSEFLAHDCTAENYFPVDDIRVPESHSRPAFQSRTPPTLL